MKKTSAGKVVVLLSSVAKAPPATTQSIVLAPAPVEPSPGTASTMAPVRPPPLPLKPVPGEGLLRVGGTGEVKLPPRKITTRWPSLSGSPVGTPLETGSAPPPLPVVKEPLVPEPVDKAPPQPVGRAPEPPKKAITRNIPIKLNQPSTNLNPPKDSIFLDADRSTTAQTPEGWQALTPGELEGVSGGLQSLDVFSRSQRIAGKPTPDPGPVPKIVEPTKAPPLEAKAPAIQVEAPPIPPPALPPVLPQTVIKKEPARPPPLPPAKPIVKPEHPGVLVAPPMVESEPVAHAEKLRQPHLPTDLRKEEVSDAGEVKLPEAPDSHVLHKAPPMITTEPAAVPTPLPALPAKGLTPIAPTTPGTVSKVTGPITLREKPSVLATFPWKATRTIKAAEVKKVEEAKPALRPPALPDKMLTSLKAGADSPKIPPETVDAEKPVAPPLPDKPPEVTPTPVVNPIAVAAMAPVAVLKSPVETSDKTRDVSPSARTGKIEMKPLAGTATTTTTPAPQVVARAEKAPLPLTRTERAKKRKQVSFLVFYGLFLASMVALYFVTLYFSRETRVEGQVIPPSGMTINNEIWLVTDFRETAAALVDELADKRDPLLQEIQERQDHVQRTQRDLTVREEKVRLLQQQIQSCKDELAGIGQEARDAAQHLWDGPGAQLDQEYKAKEDELYQTIADRAKTLKLNYQPDSTYYSPEVWANAYRLALYEVPAGVDSVKEHEWLGVQMKQWRDFLKTLDDRKEQLREQAAQIKIAPAAKITDLTGKIDDLQRRIDSTQTEEDPLKTELQQAQTELVQVQSEEENLDASYYTQLNAVPGSAIIKHISLHPNGRFGWAEDPFAEDEKERHYWIFSRATRPDGRQYWALGRITVKKDQTLGLIIARQSFVSTKAILRPTLPPDEQAQ